VVVAERGLGGLPFDLDPADRELSSSQLFAKLAPRAAVPAELQALDQRVLEMRPIYAKLQAAKDRYPDLHVAPMSPSETDGASLGGSRESVPPAEPAARLPSEEKVGQVSSALTSAECVANKACHGAGTTWHIQHIEVTATRPARQDDVQFATGVGCSINGIITYSGRYRTWWSWTNWWELDLSTGQMTGAFSRLANVDFDIETKLSNFQTGDKGAECSSGF